MSLQGRIAVTIELENGRQLPAKLHQLSITGGLLELTTYLEERAKVSLTLPIGASVLRPKAEMLFPMWSAQGFLQPFRMIHLWPQERQMLESEINEVLGQSLARQGVARTTAGRGSGLRLPRFFLESF